MLHTEIAENVQLKRKPFSLHEVARITNLYYTFCELNKFIDSTPLFATLSKVLRGKQLLKCKPIKHCRSIHISSEATYITIS